MERYRRALAEYMAGDQPIRMAEGGLTQSDYNAYVQSIYSMIASGQLSTDAQVANQLATDLNVLASQGTSINTNALYSALQSVGQQFGQTPEQINATVSVINPTLKAAGYDLSSFVPQEPPPPPPPEPEPEPEPPAPEPLTLDQSDYNAYTQSVFDRATAGQITPDQIIQEISSGFQSLQGQGYNVEADKLRSSVETVWNRSSTGADVGSEINNALFALDEILEPAGLDIGNYTFIEPPAPPPPEPEPEIPIDTGSMTGLASTVQALTLEAQQTGDYSALNQLLQDEGITMFGLQQLYPDVTEEGFQEIINAGAIPFGYTPPTQVEQVIPTIEDIPDDFYSGFQQYYNNLDPEQRGSMASELESYVAQNLDVGSVLASVNAQDYEFGGGYGGAFAPEVYDPGLTFAGYRTPQATGIDVRSPFGQYTLSEAESQKSAIAPVELPSFSREQFARLTPAEQQSLIRDAVTNFGLDAPGIPEAMLEFGVTPEAVSSAIGLPQTALPQGIQSIDPMSFATRTIPGVTPATFIPQVGDITPLSGVSSGLPSLVPTTLPTYNPISFAATPEQVAAATIGAMNAAEAEQS